MFRKAKIENINIKKRSLLQLKMKFKKIFGINLKLIVGVNLDSAKTMSFEC